jgi:hypothetical protein
MTKLKEVAVILAVTLFVIPLSMVNFAAGSMSISAAIETPIERQTLTTDNVAVAFSLSNLIMYDAPGGGQTSADDSGYIMQSFEVNCCLDGQLTGKPKLEDNTHGQIVLTGLTQGEHTIEIKGNVSFIFPPFYDIGTVDILASTVHFYVNLGLAPNVTISNLAEYKTNQPKLTITTDNPSCTVIYSLDGTANVTLPYLYSQDYNVTLTNLKDGTHSFTAYSKDIFNNTGKAETTFTVNNTINPESFSTLSIIVGGAIAGVLIVCTAVLVIFRKTKTQNNKK